MEIFEKRVTELAKILPQMKRAYPNGYRQLLREAQRLFEELSDPGSWEERSHHE